jgi:hypothetical protein
MPLLKPDEKDVTIDITKDAYAATAMTGTIIDIKLAINPKFLAYSSDNPSTLTR